MFVFHSELESCYFDSSWSQLSCLFVLLKLESLVQKVLDSSMCFDVYMSYCAHRATSVADAALQLEFSSSWRLHLISTWSMGRTSVFEGINSLLPIHQVMDCDFGRILNPCYFLLSFPMVSLSSSGSAYLWPLCLGLGQSQAFPEA